MAAEVEDEKTPTQKTMPALSVGYSGSIMCAPELVEKPLLAYAHGQLMFHFLLLHVDLRDIGAPGYAAAPRLFVTERIPKQVGLVS